MILMDPLSALSHLGCPWPLDLHNLADVPAAFVLRSFAICKDGSSKSLIHTHPNLFWSLIVTHLIAVPCLCQGLKGNVMMQLLLAL